MNAVPVVLSIAGSDSSGGAGIQADIRACMASGTYCATVVTALTAQNPAEVVSVEYVGDTMLRDQLKAVLDTLRPDAVKIGMIPCVSAVEIIADTIARYQLANVVIDPVMSATSGGSLNDGHHVSHAEFIIKLKDCLFPLSTLLTPNIPEYLKLFGGYNPIDSDCSKLLEQYNLNALLIKGGHSSGLICEDILYSRYSSPVVFSSPRIDSPHTHGTGCTLSSAIASGLAKGLTLDESVGSAKELVTECIKKAALRPLYPDNSPLQYISPS